MTGLWLRLRFAPFMWVLLTATVFALPAAVAYDGHDNTTTYDGGEVAIAYDAVATLATRDGKAEVPGDRVFFATFAEFVAANGGFVTPGQYDGVRQLSQMLRNAGVPRQGRLEVINSFQPGTIMSQTASGGENVIRFYSGGVAPLVGSASQPLGHFVTPTFPASGYALSGLALPNCPGGVTQFNLRQGATFFKGTVAPNFGKWGGGVQHFVPNLSDLIP